MPEPHGLTVHPTLKQFVETELLPPLELPPDHFWAGLARLCKEFGPENEALLAKRDTLQATLDSWHRDHRDQPWDADAYRALLEGIGYLEPPVEQRPIRTANVDPEIAQIAGTQLVVPVSNARFCINAANARWGSLYDALYGTDAIDHTGELAGGSGYNPVRGAAVIKTAAQFLDKHFQLVGGSHSAVSEYRVDTTGGQHRLLMTMAEGQMTALADPQQFVGSKPLEHGQSILLKHHGLHAELLIDHAHPIGKDSASGLADVILESAVTTIQDCEDSVAAVDAEDKTAVYRNWLGLMRGTLEVTFDKGGKALTRSLAPDREWLSVDGEPLVLPGRSLMLVRNVGHLMRNDAVLDPQGKPVFEGILDALVTATCGAHDLRGLGELRNSRTGSVYIVKPKMHGSRECEFTNRLFAAVEDILDLPRHTLKVGVMDEERRTSVNLDNCIDAVADRLVFINTGFLDRTGDEIHTSMEAGPFLPKDEIKEQPWIKAYENGNVDAGLRRGLPGRAQIGKGMWPKPDEMRQMLDSKAEHPEAGASCAWVPSPTAATLHAMHYHDIDVAERQRRLASRTPASLDDLLTPPLGNPADWTDAQVQQELNNNAQGILGYVVRWIDEGVGCSKVPDINDVGLMEDRATLRISSQHIANWLHHGVVSAEQVDAALLRMAAVVDQQNAAIPGYRAMAPDPDGSLAFQAARALVFEGTQQPNGYTEPLLHAWRQRAKEASAGREC